MQSSQITEYLRYTLVESNTAQRSFFSLKKLDVATSIVNWVGLQCAGQHGDVASLDGGR